MLAKSTDSEVILNEVKSLLGARQLAQAESRCFALQDGDRAKTMGLGLVGDAWLASNHAGRASKIYAMAVALNPKDAALRTKWAVSLVKSDQRLAARAELRRAIEVDSKYSPAHLNLGVLLAESGEHRDAIACFRSAIRLSPKYVEAHVNLARAMTVTGDSREGIQSLRRALALRPTDPELLGSLGTALLRSGSPGEACPYLRQAIRASPKRSDIRESLAEASSQMGRFAEAEEQLDRALQLRPHSADAHCTLGNVHKMQGRLEEALASYDLALAANPEHVRSGWNRSLAVLQRGDFANGWEGYELRLREQFALRIKTSRPLWDGRPLEGQTLLVHPEQGLGDVIQGVRYVPLIKQLFGGKKIIMMAPRPVLKVVQGCAGIDEVVEESANFDEFDVHVPILSLPHRFGTTLDKIPAKVPYIFPEGGRLTHWREQMTRIEGYRVGIVWQGNPHNSMDRYRSVPLYLFEPLARVPGVRLISLQRIFGGDQLRAYGKQLGVIDLAPHLRDSPEDFAETAAMIANLDLVVSTCTSVPHLAGALGAKTWLALSTNADWRWLQNRPDSPWYPTMRIFRQAKFGEWEQVFRSMAEMLQEEVELRRR